MIPSHFPLAHYIRRLCVAEAAGLAVVATVFALLDRGALTAPFPAILSAGAFEGLCLALAQASVLQRFDTPPLHWVILTVMAALAGYSVSVVGQQSLGATGLDPALWMMVAGGSALGLGTGVLMGAIQSPALPPRMRSSRWIWVNGLVWMPAMAVILLGAGLVGPGWPLLAVTLTGALTGALVGLIIGAGTGVALNQADLPLSVDHVDGPVLHDT